MSTATATKPKRIQRRRTKGWTTPPNTIYVGRPTIFGNPFVVDEDRDAEWAANMFRMWLVNGTPNTGGGLRRLAVLAKLPELRGKDLSCWCENGAPCHADILLELANQ